MIAVLIELQAELEGRELTPEEYELTLEKESAFREWIAAIAGLDKNALAEEGRKAQLKNDLLSLEDARAACEASRYYKLLKEGRHVP